MMGPDLEKTDGPEGTDGVDGHPFALGLLAGLYEFGDIDSCNEEVADLLEGKPPSGMRSSDDAVI